MSPMLKRQIAITMPRMAVNRASSFCIFAPRSAVLEPPPNALVSPVSFESWIRMSPIIRQITKKSTAEMRYQVTSVHVQARKVKSSIVTP